MQEGIIPILVRFQKYLIILEPVLILRNNYSSCGDRNRYFHHVFGSRFKFVQVNSTDVQKYGLPPALIKQLDCKVVNKEINY